MFSEKKLIKKLINMETKTVLEIKRELQMSMNELRRSITTACDKMSEMYSEDHYIVKRIRSYYSALEKQQEYVNMLDILIERKDFEGIDLLSLKIKAIADMIVTLCAASTPSMSKVGSASA